MNALGKAAILSGALTRMGPLTKVAGTAATMAATSGFMGVFQPLGVAQTVSRGIGVAPALKQSVHKLNPPAMAYGKRGLDSNRLSTSGLVQSLHKGRRTS